jgi:hypothetical protein
MSGTSDRAACLHQLKDLQTDFRDIAARAAGLRLYATILPGESFGIGFGRRVVDEDHREPDATSPVCFELRTLTDQGAKLLDGAQRVGVRIRHVSEHAVNYGGVVIPWIAYLIHSPDTLGCCFAQGPPGPVAACAVIRDGQTTTAWIDNYAEVCLTGLAALKALLPPEAFEVPGGWSDPKSPAQWARVFGVSWDTIKRRIKDGKITAKKLSMKLYQVAVKDLPASKKPPAK